MIGKNIMTTTSIGGLHQRKISKECRYQKRDIVQAAGSITGTM
jgi:hypothetical protein